MSAEHPPVDLNADNLKTTEQKMLTEMQRQTALLEVIAQQTAPSKAMGGMDVDPTPLLPMRNPPPIITTTKGKPKR